MNKHHQHHYRHLKLYESPLAYNLQKPFEFCILRGSFTNSEILMCWSIQDSISPPPPIKQHPQRPKAFELVKIVSFKYPTQRLDLMVTFFVKGKINDREYQFVYYHLSVDCLLVKVRLFTLNTSILKDKTSVFNWKGFTLPVQIPHPTQARFKFPNLLHTQKSNTSGLPHRGGMSKHQIDCM